MAKASITKTGAAASVPVFAVLYPRGIKAYDPAGNPVPHQASTTADGAGAYTLSLEETDTMSPSGMAWQITEVGQVPVYIQFGSGGGAVGSLGVSAPTTVGDPTIRGVQAGSGITLTGGADAPIIAVTNQATLAKLAAATAGPLLFDKVHIAGKTGTTAGAGGAWVVPAGGAVVLPQLCGLNVTTLATGTCNLDIGYTATNATTLADTLLDGRDGHTAGFYEQVSLSTNALVRTGNENPAPFVAAAGKWITISPETGAASDVTGMVADFYVAYYAL